MFIKNGNLVIRDATFDDAQILCNWWNDGKVMEHAGFPNGLGITEQAIVQKLMNDNDDTHRRLILEVDSIPIGEMSYYNKGSNTAEIGIKICNFDKQEKGLGTEFLKMLIECLFNEKGYNKIILDTNANNKRAQHVYEKIGFQQVAVRVDSWQNQLGEWQSSVDYELTKERFNK